MSEEIKMPGHRNPPPPPPNDRIIREGRMPRKPFEEERVFNKESFIFWYTIVMNLVISGLAIAVVVISFNS